MVEVTTLAAEEDWEDYRAFQANGGYIDPSQVPDWEAEGRRWGVTDRLIADAEQAQLEASGEPRMAQDYTDIDAQIAMAEQLQITCACQRISMPSMTLG